MTFETMEIKLGPKRANKWIECERLPERADPVTGSMDPDDIEYGVPLEWEKWTEGDRTDADIKTTKDAEISDLIDLGIKPDDVDEKSASTTQIKQEPVHTALEEFNEKIRISPPRRKTFFASFKSLTCR